MKKTTLGTNRLEVSRLGLGFLTSAIRSVDMSQVSR
jgi:hypothetical protein